MQLMIYATNDEGVALLGVKRCGVGVHYFGVVCFDDLADIPSAAVAHFGVVPVEYLVQRYSTGGLGGAMV